MARFARRCREVEQHVLRTCKNFVRIRCACKILIFTVEYSELFLILSSISLQSMSWSLNKCLMVLWFILFAFCFDTAVSWVVVSRDGRITFLGPIGIGM